MQVLLEDQDELSVVLDITVPQKDVDREINSIAASIKDRAEIKGFRKGTAPLDLVKRHYYDSLRAEASSRLIQSGVLEGLKVKNLKNIGNPVLLDEFKVTEKKKYPGKFRLDGTFNFKISVMLPPNIDVVDYMGVNVDVDVGTFTKWFSRQIRKQQLLFGDKTNVDRPAQVGDQVMATFEGFLASEPLNSSREENVSFVIGEATLLKELEDVFVGHSAGETFESVVTFPADYGVDSLAGKDVTFKCELKEVVDLKPHPLNDDFAALLAFDSLDALSENYKTLWQKEYDSVIKVQIFSEIMDQVLESNKFEAPTSWIEQELSTVAARLQIKGQNVANNPYMRKSLWPLAEKSVKSAYVLDKIYEKEESIHLTPDEVSTSAAEVANQQGLSTDHFIDQIRNQGLYEGFITQCEHKKAMEFLVANANIKERE